MIFHVYPMYFFLKAEVYIRQCHLVGAFLPDEIVIVGTKMCRKIETLCILWSVRFNFAEKQTTFFRSFCYYI